MRTLIACAISVGAARMPATARADAEFVLVNLDDPGEGINDPTPVEPIGGNPGTTLGDQRMIALQRAFEIWGDVLDSDVPTEVRVQFSHLGCATPEMRNPIARARPTAIIRGDLAGADPERWYAYALANRIAGHDLDPESAEVFMEFDSGPDSDDACQQPWYYGLDEGGPGLLFLQVALHELAHGLGVTSALDLATGAFRSGAADSFSSLVFDRVQGKHLTGMTDSERALAVTRVRQLVWDGPAVRDAAAAVLVRGTPTVSIEPPVDGFSGIVSDASFGARTLDRSVTGELLVMPRDSCSIADDAAGCVVLVDARCAVDMVAQGVESMSGVALLYARESEAWMLPPRPLDYSNPVASTIPVVTVARADAELLAAAVEQQSLTVSISLDPEQLVGADPEGRPYLHITDSDDRSAQELIHWDLLARPNLLMEGAYGRKPDQRDLDVTVALLVDIGWAICGDGRVTVPEQCDDGEGNSDTAANACRTSCRAPTCGDGVIDLGEDCDDGARNGGAALNACRPDCTLNLCGNGVIDAGEQCDDGAGNDDDAPDACRSDCTEPSCGDRVIDAGEECDAGARNGTRWAMCTDDCRIRGGEDAGHCEADSCEPDASVVGDGGACDGSTCAAGAASEATGEGCGCRVVARSHPSRLRDYGSALLLCILAWRWARRGLT